jgi:hypothetical protein
MIGLSLATYSRIENENTMDGKSLARIFNWLTTEVRRA